VTLILDQTPNHKQRVVQVGTTVRKPLPVLRAYLDALDWQELPPQTKVEYAFIADWEDPNDPAEAYLREWARDRGGEVEAGDRGGAGDYGDTGGPTHLWNESSMARVGRNKNRLLHRAVGRGADAVWLVDADLICDRTTLRSLWFTDAPIACAVYWTLWQTHVRGLQAAPQVWLQHPYGLDGRGWDAGGFRRALLNRERVQVWGQGACTLIRTTAIEKGVNFDYIPNVSREGMMAGEDRHFCLKAESLHLEMIADPWPDIFHIYHDRDVERIPKYIQRLSEPHPEPKHEPDGLVSLTLEAVEPLPVNGQYHLLPPIHLRGRLAELRLLPELEQKIRDMKRGEVSIIPVHFPQHYEQVELRGQRRLVKVNLVDCKPYGFAPVVEDEIMQGSPGVWLDPTQYTERQMNALVAP
jgi:hypothetical protein